MRTEESGIVATRTAPTPTDQADAQPASPQAARERSHWPWRIGAYVIFLGVWQLLSTFVFQRFVLPAPTVVLQEMWNIVRSGEFWENFWATARQLAIGFTLTFALGTILGIAMARSRYWHGFFRDYVMVTLTTPGLVFALLGVMIFGLSQVGPIVAIVLTSLPHVTVNVVEGVRAIPRDLLDMASAYGVDRRTRLRHIVLPAAAPFVFAALRYGFGIAWKITVLTELFGGTAGIGIQIQVYRQLFNTTGVLAWAFFMVGFALITERLVFKRLEDRFFRWRPRAFA